MDLRFWRFVTPFAAVNLPPLAPISSPGYRPAQSFAGLLRAGTAREPVRWGSLPAMFRDFAIPSSKVPTFVPLKQPSKRAKNGINVLAAQCLSDKPPIVGLFFQEASSHLLTCPPLFNPLHSPAGRPSPSTSPLALFRPHRHPATTLAPLNPPFPLTSYYGLEATWYTAHQTIPVLLKARRRAALDRKMRPATRWMRRR